MILLSNTNMTNKINFSYNNSTKLGLIRLFNDDLILTVKILNQLDVYYIYNTNLGLIEKSPVPLSSPFHLRINGRFTVPRSKEFIKQ